MTNQEINQAIAEHLGWTGIRMSNVWEITDPPEDGSVLCGQRPDGRLRAIPSYSTDLNALREAVAGLTELEMFRYTDEVCDLAYDGHHDTAIQMILKMGAGELAECYVRAIGKWRDK